MASRTTTATGVAMGPSTRTVGSASASAVKNHRSLASWPSVTSATSTSTASSWQLVDPSSAFVAGNRRSSWPVNFSPLASTGASVA